MNLALLRAKRPQLVMFIIAAVFLSLQFIVPATLPPHTVEGLEGRANIVDYQDKWDDLPPIHAAVYWFGDLNCHQYHYRSYTVNHNQVPMCVRDIGVFLGLSTGFLLLLFVEPTWSVLGTTLQVIPSKLREPLLRKIGEQGTAFLLIIFCLVPLGVDGFVQALTSYESDNLKRLLTGIPAGALAGIFIGGIILTMLALPDTFPAQPPQNTNNNNEGKG